MPQMRGLAGLVFAHCCIANPGETGGTWALRLVSSSKGSNSFVLHDLESSEMAPSFLQIKQELLSFQPKDLGHLYDNVYYTLTIIKHPLFNSFIIGFSTPRGSTSGLQKGYLVAQDIIEQIQQQCGPGQPSQEKKPDLKGKGKGEDSGHCQLR